MDGIVEFDEFVTDVLGSGGVNALNIKTYQFNPGQSALFPLGSAECAKWTNWKCISATPYLDHEVSEFATDGSTGKVYLAFDYNASNLVATTKQQLADMHHTCCMPCEDISLPLLTKYLNRADPKYVRVGNPIPGTDIKLYDGGILYVAAIGQAGTTKVAELHIRYKFKVELKTLLNPVGSSGNAANTMVVSGVGGELAAATTVAQVAFQTAVLPPLFVINTIGIGPVGAGGGIPLPSGVYSIEHGVTISDSAADVTAGFTYLTNSATLTNYVVEGNMQVSSSNEAVSTFKVVTSNASGPIIWNTAVLGTTLILAYKGTYGAGVAYADAWVSITQLRTTP
jgi:hypothetical protein